LGLSVFTVAVVLGAGASEVFTLPLLCDVRPESGSCVACVPCVDPAGAPNCAKAGAAHVSAAAATDANTRSLLLPKFEALLLRVFLFMRFL
jgi:hypothetical protein